MMRLLIIGSLAGELGRAASIAAKRGASVDQADDPDRALALLRRNAAFDLVFCDIVHDIAGLITALATERINVGVIACGTDADPEIAAHAMRSGAREFLPLPPDASYIAALLESATRPGPSIVARDPAMVALMRRAEQVARSNASILICGESGTGKEVLARFLHEKSARASRPFVAINCAAIPENLLESELFGHEKGAFSGAVARRLGKFETADGGTLLLDEVSEMDIRLQAKLLRVLQEREIDRVGGQAPVKVDVRILATSNRAMRDEVQAGRFRADLFFRLNVITLQVPALRNRPLDIAGLAAHYAAHYAALNGAPRRRISPSALKMLEAHPWPGNVRELENTIHRAVLLSAGDELDEDGIDTLSRDPADDGETMDARDGARRDQHASGLHVSDLVGHSVEDVERALIIETLGHTAGNRTHAASLLGISIRALRNKLRDYSSRGFDVPAPAGGVAA
jgi:DNA-binding NtrC family response regulator